MLGRRLLESRRVLGVGVGVFVIGFFLTFSVILCLLGSRTRRPGVVYSVSSFILGLVVLILVASPKSSQEQAKDPRGYDQTVIPYIILSAFMGAAVVGSLVAFLKFKLQATLYGKPLHSRQP